MSPMLSLIKQLALQISSLSAIIQNDIKYRSQGLTVPLFFRYHFYFMLHHCHFSNIWIHVSQQRLLNMKFLQRGKFTQINDIFSKRSAFNMNTSLLKYCISKCNFNNWVKFHRDLKHFIQMFEFCFTCQLLQKN